MTRIHRVEVINPYNGKPLIGEGSTPASAAQFGLRAALVLRKARAECGRYCSQLILQKNKWDAQVCVDLGYHFPYAYGRTPEENFELAQRELAHFLEEMRKRNG